MKVGLVTDVGRLNDKSFNQSSWEGVQQAEKELGVEIKAIETVDTKDYEKGVWTLPPNYAAGETDKAKYTAIGESDRMTLKFVKPQ